MTMQIKAIFLYNHAGDIRRLNFKEGAVNIIAGKSNTGKSAIIPIIEYCLGVSDFHIPGEVIRKTVAYYAVLYGVDNRTVFIAKPPPHDNSGHQHRAFYVEDPKIIPPPLESLRLNTNDSEIAFHLNKLLLGTQIPRQQAGSVRSIENTLYYLFQKSTIISHDSLLFHRQERHSTQIKATLPYFLGIREERDALLEQQANEARLALQRLRNQISEEKRRTNDLLNRGRTLVQEAAELQLITKATPVDQLESVSDYGRILSQAFRDWQPGRVPMITDDRLPRLQDELEALKNAYHKIQLELQFARSFQREEVGYTQQIEDQRLRLQSIEVISEQNPFEFAESHTICPLCNSSFENSHIDVPRISLLRAALQKLNTDLESVQHEQPVLTGFISNLEDQLDRQKHLLDKKQLDIATIVQNVKVSENVLEEITEANRRVDRLLGRIELYVDLATSDNTDTLEKERERAERTYAELQILSSGRNVDDVNRRVLSTVSDQMTEWSRRLDFSYSGRFLFDLEALTVIVDTATRSIRMQDMGGSANYLGCHLITLLALHKQFIDNAQPVPGFLILDQPAQGYFPASDTHAEATRDQVFEITGKLGDVELSTVKKMLEFLFDTCATLSPQMQIIILEHANLDDAWFQNALVNGEAWFGDSGLIPQSWIDVPSSSKIQMELFT